MKRILFSMALSVALLAPMPGRASQEGVLRLNEFRLSSQGIGDSGPVVVSGAQSDDRFVALRVEAFGRVQSLPAGELGKLKGGLVNGLQLTFDSGYRQLGGRTIYIHLSKGFTSGVQETQVVSLDEQGQWKVGDAAPK